jgi:hypothetical protein
MFEFKEYILLVLGKISIIKIVGKHIGGKWRFELFIKNMLEVDIAHPGVIEDLLDGVISVLDIFLQEPVQEVFELC